MPIRKENKAKYPVNWRQISENIKRRAGWRCECNGECGLQHDMFGFTLQRRCNAEHGKENPISGSMVVLTTAHLDHRPENCAPENLKAMCQLCHLRYDADEHKRTQTLVRYAELEAAGQLPLLPRGN